MSGVSGKTINPFGDSRVDNPFQVHADLKSVYLDEFQILKSVISEIKNDSNYQSRGVAVIGEPGTGKTHLMMRLAGEVLSSNRLLFIRQPNNPNFILYHVYSRILESLVENVPGTPYSQIEHLLSKSFSKIIINTIKAKTNRSAKDGKILELLSSDHLNIYKKIGKEGTEAKRKNWRYIETKTLEWWSNKYGFGGLSLSIVKGLIRFCSYSDAGKRDLVRRWLSANSMEKKSLESIGLEDFSETISKEEFAIEAISVFGKLSIEDEPLIVIFDQLEGLKYNNNLLFSFGEAVKDIFTHLPNSMIIFNLFPDRWEEWQSLFDDAVVDRISQHRVYLNTPEKSLLKSILTFRANSVGLKLEDMFSRDEMEVITDRPSIRGVLNCASDYYRLNVQGVPLPKRIMSFEEEVRESIRQLRNEIGSIKKFLNMAGPTFREMEMSDEISAYIQDQKTNIIAAYEKQTIISDSDDSGKLSIIFEASKEIAGLKSERMKIGRRKFPEYVMVKTQDSFLVFGFLNHEGNAFTSRIKNFNLLAESKPDIIFILIRDTRSSGIKSKVAKSEIKKLEESENGQFMTMDMEKRIAFELIYKAVTDIRNRDLDATINAAFNHLNHHLGTHWLYDLISTTPDPQYHGGLRLVGSAN